MQRLSSSHLNGLRAEVIFACALFATFAVSAAPAAAADGAVDTFTAKLSSKQHRTARGKVVLVKSVVLRGPGLLQGRPQIKCGKGKCLRLSGKRYSRSKFYKPKVTFKNTNLLVKRGESVTIRLVANDKKLLGRYLTFSLKRKGKLRLRQTASGCITGGGKLTACPPPPGLNCNRPAQNLSKTSLAGYLGTNTLGTVDVVAAQPSNSINVRGWAFDPETPDVPVWIHAYVDGVFAGAYLADLLRADVNTVNPGANSNHGYAFNIPNVASGNRTVAIYAIDPQGVYNPLLWSGTVAGVQTAQLGSPFGALESAVAVGCGEVELTGWTADPSSPSDSTDVHVYIDGWPGNAARSVSLGFANLARPDVAASYPGHSVNRGFRSRIGDLSPGPHIFFVYAINGDEGSGENPLLRTIIVNVP